MRQRTTAFSSRHVESDKTQPSRRLLSNRSLSMKPSIDSRIGLRCLARPRYSSFFPGAGCTSKTTTNMFIFLSLLGELKGKLERHPRQVGTSQSRPTRLAASPPGASDAFPDQS